MKRITEEAYNLLLEMVHELRLPVMKAAKLLNLNYSTALYMLKHRGEKEVMRSRFYSTKPIDIGKCSVCEGKMWLEEIPADCEAGYLIPAETGDFDLVCSNGHRFQCHWKEVENRKEKEHGLQATAPAGDNAGISLRREEIEAVGDSLDSSAEAGRGEVSMPHRRSWRSHAAEQRRQRDNECASHQERVGGDEHTEGDRT